MEQLPQTVNARRHVFEAKRLREQADLDAAKQEFELAWQDWGATFQEHRELVNELTEEDLAEDIQEYVKLLGQLDEELPPNFALQEILSKFTPPPAPPTQAPPTQATPTADATSKPAAAN